MIKRTRHFKKLDNWHKSPDRHPLLVRGSRQVGKTFLVREWAKTNPGMELAEINFEERPEAKKIFEKNLDIERIIDELSFLSGNDLRKPNILIFLDEIQAEPKAVLSLRYFYEKQPAIPIVAAGSLLELVLMEISFPVGRIENLFIPPVSFEEFLQHFSNDYLIDYFQKLSPETLEIPDTAHQQLMDAFFTYIKVGGMPKATAAYLETRSFAESSRVHEMLLRSYRDDFPKYATKTDLAVLSVIFDKLALVAGGSRVKYSFFSRELRSEKIKSALRLLHNAYLITKIHSVSGGSPPLAASINPDIFKIAFLDIGLLQHFLGFDWRTLSNDTDVTEIANGRFSEQFVAQELIANRSDSARYQICYWERMRKGSDAEIDYLVEFSNAILPVEVKSGKRGTLRSLMQYEKEFKPKTMAVLSQNNLSRNKNLLFLPIYMASKL